jgi:FMN phosphatase YigB (HAD superfamily)
MTDDSAPFGGVVFLLDVDNTLLDNDRFQEELGQRVEELFGAEERARYWGIFASQRDKVGIADYLSALQEFRTGHNDDPNLLQMSGWLLEYPFAKLVYPGALAAIANLHTLGRPAVLSDGDVIFQPRKVQHSGVWDAVQGRVMIYVHKEQVLDHVQRRYAAAHYVMVDDKPNLLAAMKLKMGDLLTTVFVRQGHYALAADASTHEPKPDLVIERIGELTSFNLSDFKVAL